MITDFFKINGNKLIAGEIEVNLLSIVATIIVLYLVFKLRDSGKSPMAFTTERRIFINTFALIQHKLEVGDENLNFLIVNDYPALEIEKRKFVHNLHGLRKHLFLRKWKQYQNEYEYIKSLGQLGPFIVLAPDQESLKNKTPYLLDKWDHDRREKFANAINDIIKASAKRWYF